jgi:hypothetical protein
MVAASVKRTGVRVAARIPADLPELVTIQQAAAEFKLSRATLFRMLRAGQIQRYQAAGKHLTYIDRRELRRLLRPRVVKER